MTRSCFFTCSSLAISVLLAMVSPPASSKPPPRRGVELIKPDETTTVVSFVRRSIFMGDGWNYDIWDGPKYVGKLGPARLLQYRASPGEHTFMVMARGAHEWNFLKANVLPGKEYFIRANPIPFHLGAADARTDERIEEWLSMSTDKELTDKQREKVEKKNGEEAVAALAAMESGVVPSDCALWHPGYKTGDKHSHATLATGTCAAVGELKPEFGR